MIDSSSYHFAPGTSPLILSMPHVGTDVPPDVWDNLNDVGQQRSDTDWHIDRVYDFARDLGASVLRARYSRYVIDLNRDPAGTSLYPGQATTDLIPTTDFDGAPIWHRAPDAIDVAQRVLLYHRPYHHALREAIATAKAAHGYAIVYDCHSIRSRVPRLFDGVLPDLNIGTFDGASCDVLLEHAVIKSLESNSYSHILNGRFKGGWITRHYGQPHDGVHAIQMEIAQSTYLTAEAAPWDVDDAKLERLQETLQGVLQAIQASLKS